MQLRKSLGIALLACGLSGPAFANDNSLAGINAEIKRDMAEARKELRAEIAKARAELETEDLALGEGISFGKGKKSRADELPPAHITPAGELVIDGKPIATTPGQRQQLLAYRRQVIQVAKAGIDGGEKAALAALEITDASLLSLIFNALTGSLERRVENTVKQHVQPMVLQICRSLPELRASQQALAGSLPQFRPYATIKADDYKDCEREVRRELAFR